MNFRLRRCIPGFLERIRLRRNPVYPECRCRIREFPEYRLAE
jgi:hypothetical protein